MFSLCMSSSTPLQDALFERHVSAVDPKGEYRSNIPELKLDEYFERFKDLLKAQYGNPDQIDMFLGAYVASVFHKLRCM